MKKTVFCRDPQIGIIKGSCVNDVFSQSEVQGLGDRGKRPGVLKCPGKMKKQLSKFWFPSVIFTESSSIWS